MNAAVRSDPFAELLEAGAFLIITVVVIVAVNLALLGFHQLRPSPNAPHSNDNAAYVDCGATSSPAAVQQGAESETPQGSEEQRHQESEVPRCRPASS